MPSATHPSLLRRLLAVTATLCALTATGLGAAAPSHGLVRSPHPSSSPTPSASPSGGASCGGEAPVKPDGSPWTCTFDDEFSGTGLDTSRWTAQLTASSGFTTGPAANRACYVNNPNTISVSGGSLNLTVLKTAAPFTCASSTGSFTTSYQAGMETTFNSFHQTYGRFEASVKLPSTTAAGLQETLWAWPVNSLKYGAWPRSGEIDYSEFYSQHAGLDIPYVHYSYLSSLVNALTDTNEVTAYHCTINVGAYNDYVLQWLPGQITIWVNGATCLIDNYRPYRLTAPAPFDQPFFLAFTQALGIGTNAFNPATTPLPATTSIDYVRAWS